MTTTIITKNSSTASAVPLAADLVQGELAVNVTDKRVYTKNASAAVIEVGTNPSTITTTTVNGLTVGKGAGSVATNTAVGASALAANTTGAYETALGANALAANTSGNYNTAVGYSALVANTTGANSLAVGLEALKVNTTGSNNTALGMQALVSNTTASNNTAVGYQAGYSQSTNGLNTYFGRLSGYNSTGIGNTFLGTNSGYSSTGSYNTFVGANNSGGGGAGQAMTTGSKNTILGGYDGNQGGLDIRTASNYIVLSDGDGNPRGIFDSSGNLLVGTTTTNSGLTQGMNVFINGGSTQSFIGHVTGTASGTYYSGYSYNGSLIGSITQNGTTGVLYNLTSDYRLKNDQQPLTGAKEFVMALQPKKWQWWDGSGEGVGFIAHEFMEVAKYSGHGEKDAVDEEGNIIAQSIQPSSSEVMANLVAFIQELKAELDAAKADIATLKGAA